MRKIKLGLVVGLVLLMIGVIVYISEKNAKPVCEKCNIIFITLDTLSAKHLPCYGYERDTSPNLCKFAKENVLFAKNYSAANWTLPSHFSTFTSLLPSIHKMIFFTNELDKDYKTLTEILKENHYDTVFIGTTSSPPLAINEDLGRGFNQIIGKEELWVEDWKDSLKIIRENREKGVPTFMFLHTFFCS